MLDKLKNLFTKDEYTGNYEGKLYFINAGRYKGDFYVVVKENNNSLTLYNLTPDPTGDKVIEVVTPVLESGLKGKIVDFVERLPYNIYIDCKNVYLKNENSNSGLQQSTVPDILAVEEQDSDE